MPQRSERYRTTSGSEVGIELDPQQAKVVEVYGFVGWIVAYAALTGYILWAYLPESVLHSIGVTYYPDRYWAVAAPSMLLMLVMFYTTIYGLIGMANNPHVDSFDCLVDGYSKHHVPVPLPAVMHSSGLLSVGGFAAAAGSNNMSPPITVVAPAAGSSPGAGQAQQLSAPARRNSLLASLRHTALGPGALPGWSTSLVPPSSAFSASSIGSSSSAIVIGSSAAALSGGGGADKAAIAAAMHRRWGHLAASILRRWKVACRAAIAGGGRARALSAFASGGREGLLDRRFDGDGVSGGAAAASGGAGPQQRRQRRSPRLSAGANAYSNVDFTGTSSSPDAESADAAAAAAFAAAAAASAASRRPRGSSCPPLDRLAQHVSASSGSIGSLTAAGLASASKVLRPQLLAHGSGLGFTDELSPAVATSGSSGSGLRLPSNSSGSGSGSDDSPHSLLRPLRGDTAAAGAALGTGPAIGGFKAMGAAGGGAFRPRAGSGTVLLSSSASVSAPAAGSGIDGATAGGHGSGSGAGIAGAAGQGHGGLFGERARRSLGYTAAGPGSALAATSGAGSAEGQLLPSGGGHRHSASGPLLTSVAAAGARAAFASGRGGGMAIPGAFPLSSSAAPLASVSSGQSYLGSAEAAAAAAASVWLPSGVSKQMGTPDIADLPVSALNRLQFMAPLLAVAARRRAKQEAAAMAAAAAAAAGRIAVPRP